LFSAQESLFTFRGLPSDVGRLAAALHLDAEFALRRYRVEATECLAIVLRHLVSPALWAHLEVMFWPLPLLAQRDCGRTVERLMSKRGHLLRKWRGEFMAERAAVSADAVRRRGARLQTCVSFIDGISIHVARPGGGLQRACYSGHKRRYVRKFQSVTTPDGLFLHMYNPHEGRRHDIELYHDS